MTLQTEGFVFSRHYVQTIYNVLNCVDRPSKTGVMINIVRHVFFANIAVMFAAHLVQDEAIKTGCSRESVRKHEVFTSKRARSTPTNHKIIW